MPTNYNPDTDALETGQERFAREAEVDERIMRGEREKAANTEHTPEPTGWFFTDDPQVVAMPGSGYFPGPTPPNDAINLVPLYAHPDPRVAELEKQRDELLEVFQLVISEMKHRDRNDGNAPGHGHSIPGVWDSDNGALAGKPCAWCAVWKKAKEICADIASVKEKA